MAVEKPNGQPFEEFVTNELLRQREYWEEQRRRWDELRLRDHNMWEGLLQQNKAILDLIQEQHKQIAGQRAIDEAMLKELSEISQKLAGLKMIDDAVLERLHGLYAANEAMVRTLERIETKLSD